MSVSSALLDTSIFIGGETGRFQAPLPTNAAVSVVTLSELHLGVLRASNHQVRAQRLRTLSFVQDAFEALAMDTVVARLFAELMAEIKSTGRSGKIMDTWIAATALAHNLTVFTQDEDFLVIPRVKVMRV